MNDLPYVSYSKGEDGQEAWSPNNWDGKHLGIPVTLRYGLSRSLNTIDVGVRDETGGNNPAIRLIRNMGITARIDNVPSLPLGIYAAKPIELVSAYTAFANGGVKSEAHTIKKIEDKYGNIIFEANTPPKEVLNKNTTFILTNMLRSSVNSSGHIPGGAYGTSGSIARIAGYDLQIAAKTGTTNENKDAWVIAYTPKFTAGLWIGIDQPEKSKHLRIKHNVGLYSSKITPVMGEFIKRVYEAYPKWRSEKFSVPDGVIKLKICLDHTENMKLATDYCPKTTVEYFLKKYEPTLSCDIHNGAPIKSNRRRRRN